MSHCEKRNLRRKDEMIVKNVDEMEGIMTVKSELSKGQRVYM